MSLTLLHSPADIVSKLLVDLALATDPATWTAGSGSAWPAFVAGEPDRPDNCITVYDTTPITRARSIRTGERIQGYGIQVRVRSQEFPEGNVKGRAIELAFNETVKAATVEMTRGNNEATYVVYSIDNGSLLTLGKDTSKTRRNLFTFNAFVSLRRKS